MCDGGRSWRQGKGRGEGHKPKELRSIIDLETVGGSLIEASLVYRFPGDNRAVIGRGFQTERLLFILGEKRKRGDGEERRVGAGTQG